jgi:carboxypeptidase C (cathepsin A)
MPMLTPSFSPPLVRAYRIVLLALIGALIGAPPLPAQGGRGRAAAASAETTRASRDTNAAPPTRPAEEKPPVITHHEMRIGDQVVRYTAYTGMMPIRNEKTGVTEGHMFYVYYAKDGANPTTRPISFFFNGGPGSSTVWLHMGAFGPRRVHLDPDGTNPPPPYTVEDNPYTLLGATDLVFLDPVGTGYSRPTKPEYGPHFWGVDEDMRSVGEFIRLFLVQYRRWGSPKFIGGESYGTTRAAHLSGWLVDNGIALNGIILISCTSFQAQDDDSRAVGFFPSYAAIAWYHKKLPQDLQSLPLEQVVAQAEAFAEGPYLRALRKGNRLSAAERAQVVEQYARLTGLAKSFVEQNDLRVPLARFDHELLRDRGLMVGRLDGRFTGHAADAGAERNDFDPSEASIRNSFTPVLNDYVRRELGYENDDIYYILGGGIGPWNRPAGLDVRTSLERAFNKNPAMKVYVAMGYYDTATPFWAVEYTLGRLQVSPEIIRNNIITRHFTAGHMVYIDDPSMRQLHADLEGFYSRAVEQREPRVTAGPAIAPSPR